MRLSNVFPHSSAAFDVTRHLTRGDVIFGQKLQYLTLLILVTGCKIDHLYALFHKVLVYNGHSVVFH